MRSPSEPLVIDAARIAADADGAWFGTASGALRDGRNVIIRHLEDLPRTDANRVKILAAEAGTIRTA